VSRFKQRETVITVDENSIRIRALTPGERDEFANIARGTEDKQRLPYFMLATCAMEPRLTEQQVKDEVPTDLLEACCDQIMAWSKPRQKKADSPTKSDSAVE
jgi:hypothetical protein